MPGEVDMVLAFILGRSLKSSLRSINYPQNLQACFWLRGRGAKEQERGKQVLTSLGSSIDCLLASTSFP